MMYLYLNCGHGGMLLKMRASYGITPYANLYHYDLSLALEKKYMGLLNRQVVEDFADYADFCFKTFGDRAKNWMTFNEPRVIAALGYDNGLHNPGRCTNSTEIALRETRLLSLTLWCRE